MRDYQRQLQTLRDQIAQREEDLAVLVQLEQQEEACRRKVEECHTRWEQEQKDVDRLERVSLAALLSALRGSKDEDMDREQAEAYAARMRLQEAERQLAGIQEEILDRRRRIEETTGCRKAYEQLLREKEDAICAQDPALARQLQATEERILELTTWMRELNEAVQAGRQALFCLSAAIDRLESARGWGTWDVLGGGMFTDVMKYSHINEAQAQMEHLGDALRRYQAELGDVPDLAGEANVDLRPGEFTWTLDLFLDNIFTDGMVLHQLSQAGDRLGALKSRIEILQDRLERNREESQAALDQACAERDQIVLQA